MGSPRGYASLTPGCDIARLQRAEGMRTYGARLVIWVSLAGATTRGRPYRLLLVFLDFVISQYSYGTTIRNSIFQS